MCLIGLILNRVKVRLILIFLVFSKVYGQTGRDLLVSGIVLDSARKPLEFATVNLLTTGEQMYTDTAGKFSFRTKSTGIKSVSLRVSMVGKKTAEYNIPVDQLRETFIAVLEDLSLTLKEVQVNGQRKTQSSNSSIVFDRQAIEQVQAFSIFDVLNNLPGRAVSAPSLQNPQNLTLRGLADGAGSLNNSLGIAVIVDGVTQSNNANMQNKNAGHFGMAGSVVSSYNKGDFDVPFAGIDLREIPADNIESIEVVSGVASAKYGDLTDGAVIIERKAGEVPYQFSARINGGSTNVSLGKGYKLGGKLGALNADMNYLYSNDDPTNKQKIYKRLSGGLRWTSQLSSSLSNTFSVDYTQRFDDAMYDPDDIDHMSYSRTKRIAFSNRSSLKISSSIVNSISLNLSYDASSQDSYTQRWLNGNPKGVTFKDTTGIYEGIFIPGTYMAVEQVMGKPRNYAAALNISGNTSTGRIRHQLGAGASISLAENNGRGVVADPDRPRWVNARSHNDRPYDYELVPAMVNTGLYAEDRMTMDVFGRELSLTAGLRYDMQNSYGNIQPRLNANYKLNKELIFNVAYGISTKSPTLAHRYPSPVYYDIPLINYYTGDVRESLFLVYTYKHIPDNSSLKPSRATQAEAGLSWKKKAFSSSLFTYYKKNRNLFNSVTTYRPFTVPVFEFTAIPGQKPVYAVTDKTELVSGTSESVIMNTGSSDNFGAEWSFSTKKFPGIQTSFSLNSTFNYSTFKNTGERYLQAPEQYLKDEYKGWFGVYPVSNSDKWNLQSRFTSDTHIPQLGFVLSLNADITWISSTKSKVATLLPVAYLDQFGNRYPIPVFNPDDPDYGHLLGSSNAKTNARLPSPYANLSLRLAKEIKKKIRFSLNAYNVLNRKVEHYNSITDEVISYVDPVSINAEISIKF